MAGSHNEIRNSLALMGIHKFSSYSIHNKPIISSNWDRTGTHTHWYQADRRTGQTDNTTINATSDNTEGLRGDRRIRHMWQRQTKNIIDIRLVDTDENHTSPAHWKFLWRHNGRKIKINTSLPDFTNKNTSPPLSFQPTE